MELREAKETLRNMSGAMHSAQWGQEVTTAVQRALAELYLLNPYDDVDGLIGSRTRNAWKLFKEVTHQADPDTLEAGSAGQLIQAVDNPAGFIGQVQVPLQSEFAFRRRHSQVNKATSAQAIMQEAKAQQLTKAQIAYILATAEHESDSFNTLEEYSSGTQYNGRADLGNSQPDDGPRFKGRGYVQLTGRLNYTTYTQITGIELVKLPLILMNWPALSVFVIVDGMMRGVYTGQRLNKFVNSSQTDFFNARQVVNGHDKADKIAAQAQVWLSQLP